MRFIIDRFQDKYAICELYTNDPFEGYTTEIEISKIPDKAQVGDVLIVKDDAITIDDAETSRMEMEIKKLTDDIWYR